MALIKVHWSKGACVISDDHPKAMHGLFLRWLMRGLNLDGPEALFRLQHEVLDQGPMWIKLSDSQNTRDLIAWFHSLEGMQVTEIDVDESKLSNERGLEAGE